MNGHTIVSLPLDRVAVGPRLRPVDGDYVALIAASLAERGQDTPIVVAPAGDDGRHALIAGAHRVAAARSLGWGEIAAVVREADALTARLIEIDENLVRRELSALDRAVFLAERKAVWEALHPETRRGGDRRGTKRTSLSVWSAFARHTAAKLGVDERSIRRAVARAALPAEIRERIATLPIAARGAELDKLLALPPERRRAVVDELTRPERPAASVGAALARLAGPEAQSKAELARLEFGALVRAWRKAGRAARAQFLAFLETEGALPGREAA